MIAFVIIVLVIALLLFSPVGVRISYDNGFVYRLTVFGFSFSFPKRKKQKKETGTKKADNNSLLKDLKSVKKLIPRLVKNAVLSVKVKTLNLKLTVASADPCDTAIAYGALNAAVYGVITTARRYIKIKKQNISITADYQKEKTEIMLDLHITTTLLKLIILVIKVFLQGE